MQNEYIDLIIQEPDQEEPQQKIEPNPLNSVWVFWHASRKEEFRHIKYAQRLLEMSKVATLEDFFSSYLFIKSVDNIDRHNDLALFKSGYKPMWESCPDSGCWFIRFKQNDDPLEIDLIWEKLLFGLVGEQFEEPNMLGAVLSLRGRETIIELWFNYFKDTSMKNKVAAKMRSLLLLDDTMTIYFKDTEMSLKDNSTLRNAETYSFVRKS